MESNTVHVTDEPADLEVDSKNILLEGEHWFSRIPQAGKKYQVRLRHRGELIGCRIDGRNLILDMSASAVAPGQSAVVYDGEECLGGGIIRSAKVKLPV